MRKAFTLIEMVVALGILALVLSFAGVIFRVSIDSYRLAAANAEIMQKLRVITDQLERDFEGAILGYTGTLEARQFSVRRGGKDVQVNSDSIAVFVNGAFQTLGTYYGGKPVAGNVACVYYEQPDPNSYGSPAVDNDWSPAETILLRRETILAGGLDPTDYGADSGPHKEYYISSLAQWKVNSPFTSVDTWFLHPRIDPNGIAAYQPTYLARGVDNFTIEYGQRDPATRVMQWRRDVNPNVGAGTGLISTAAFKFTFTLYDSKGVMKNGRVFTHVIVLGD